MTNWFADGVPVIFWWCAAAGGLLVALILFWKPLKGLGRLAARTGVGLAALAVFSPVGGMMGISLGVNLLNGVVLGLLGLPGFGLLLMLNWIL